jgi:hypothetical protein
MLTRIKTINLQITVRPNKTAILQHFKYSVCFIVKPDNAVFYRLVNALPNVTITADEYLEAFPRFRQASARFIDSFYFGPTYNIPNNIS